MAFIRKYRRGKVIYYAVVESYRDELGRPRQRLIRWIGKHPPRGPHKGLKGTRPHGGAGSDDI